MTMFCPNLNPDREDAASPPPAELPPVEECFEQLSAYLDGELSPQEARQVEDWLASDPQAQQLYSQLSALQAGLANLKAPTLDPVQTELLISRVFEKLDRRPEVALGWRRRSGFPWRQVAAAVVALAGAGWAGWRWLHPQPLVSLEDPPVRVAIVPASAWVAQRYLFEPGQKQDAYSILFESLPNSPTDLSWE
ncbi:zf-HC2 domain-containing protein [Synechococcus sp. R70.1]|uniref:anti-sigma factor family protein n=1 Tax=Synechococcus sp. R70.1 TaxID=2964531 RepID=UPI0039C0EFB4